MQLHNLKSTPGSRPTKHRVGRGHAAGKGKQAGKGQSGQNKRGGTRPGFEGGQNPWFRRLPKRGFNNAMRIEYAIISLNSLDEKFEDGDEVNGAMLVKKGLVHNEKQPIKVLANGEITKKLTIKIHAISKKAKEAIEKAGGKVEVL